ncbi:uncharacterized protein LOC144107076 [Amblyomma americanum]
MKALLCQFCLLVLLLRPGSGVPCNGESYQALRRQCVLGLQQKVKAVRGDLTQNCRDYVNFTTCLRDSWNASYCGNAADEAWKNDTLFNRVEKKYFPDCPGVMGLEKGCDPDKAVQTFILCGNEFYKSSVNIFQNRATVSLTSICLHVDDYEKCAKESERAAGCSSRYRIAPGIRFIADGVMQRYRLVCTALRRSALQKGTTACNRQRFVNDMFLCGFHFANIMEVASKDSSISPCPYIEKYKKCHNASLETYGCAPPDQLHKDAEKFFEFLTQKFLDKCKGDTKSPTYARVSLFSSKRARNKSCNQYKFIGHFLKCSTDFMNETAGSTQYTDQMCHTVGFYRRCVGRARLGTHCVGTSDLDDHLSSMENSVLGKKPSKCPASKNQPGTLSGRTKET